MHFAPSMALAAALALLTAAPASAAAGFMSVQYFQFAPDSVQVRPGEKVDFNFERPSVHTATLRSGQTDRYDSGFTGAGRTESHRFRYPGRFALYCIPHPEMTARVRVGSPETVRPRITNLEAAPGDGRVQLSFRVSERAVISIAVGQSRLRRTFARGRRAITIGGLDRGRRTARLQTRDGWGNQSRVARAAFRVR